MKYKGILFITFISAMFLSCSSDEPVEDPELLFSADASLFKDKWIIITNESGSVLDYKQVTEESTLLEFIGVSSDQTVSVTSVFILSDVQQITLQTYQGLPKGTKWNDQFIPRTPTPYPDIIGTADVTIENYSDGIDPRWSFFFSDGYSAYNGILEAESDRFEGSSFKGRLKLRSQNSDILVTTYFESVPVYYIIEDIKPGDNITIDFTSFSTMKTISLNKKASSGHYVRGLFEPDAAPSDALSDILTWQNSKSTDQSQPQVLGYIEGYNYYSLGVSHMPDCCNRPFKMFHYLELSSTIPASITIPEFELEVLNKSVEDFSYHFNQSYSSKFAYFRYNDEPLIISWLVNTPPELEFMLPQIPGEILKEIPQLENLGKMDNKILQFTDHLDGSSYLDVINSRIQGIPIITSSDYIYSINQ